jgi:hypothetical protein
MTRRTALLGAVTVAAAIAAALVVVAPTSAARAATHLRVQKVTLTIGPAVRGQVEGRMVESNFAVAPGLPVQLKIVNFTPEFHTFIVPGLGVRSMIYPAKGSTPRTTTVRFTALKWGAFSWYCVLCKHGVHGNAHMMGGKVYAIIGSA